MRVHLVDGTFELFRAWFGSPRRAAADGREVGATLGLLRNLGALRRDGATHVAVAFDHVIESFRNELFPGYKTGAGVEPGLLAQFPLAEEAARALGVVVWPMIEFEADDALATAAVALAADPQVEQVIVCTPDKDLAQVVRGDRIVTHDRIRRTTLDEAGVVEKFGVAPGSIPDWLALVGDGADGIPGVPRWGARSAAAVLAAYGHIDAIPTDPAAWAVKVRGAAALSASLEAHREAAALYRILATARVDVPLPDLSPAALAWGGPDPASVESFRRSIGAPA